MIVANIMIGTIIVFGTSTVFGLALNKKMVKSIINMKNTLDKLKQGCYL